MVGAGAGGPIFFSAAAEKKGGKAQPLTSLLTR